MPPSDVEDGNGRSVPTRARNDGLCGGAETGPARMVFAFWSRGVATKFPLLVTAVEGTELSMIPLPTKATDETPPLLEAEMVLQPKPAPFVHVRAFEGP